MSEPRLTAANARVAHQSLAGKVAAPNFLAGTPARIALAVADLCRSPGGPRDKQMVLGQRFRTLEIHDGQAFGFDERDGYVGYIAQGALGPDVTPTHRVIARQSHVYPTPDIRSHETMPLHFGSEVVVATTADSFCELADGRFVPTPHLAPIDAPGADPLETAVLFLGTPYLWGGDTGTGIDCSGLVQRALWAAGRDCPRDSDQQCDAFAVDLALDAPAGPGDLFFWKGHVAICEDPHTLIHANAYHMSVAREPVAAAIARIADGPTGPVTARGRLPSSSE